MSLGDARIFGNVLRVVLHCHQTQANDYVVPSNGMINVSPVGRNASVQERKDYQKYDLQHGIRTKFIDALKKEFPDLGLT